MSTNTSATSRRRRRHGSSLPAWILLNNGANIGRRSNATTAIGKGRNNLTTEASIWPSQPPLPSNLFVYCPGAKFPRHSIILFSTEDLLLFRVPVATGPPPHIVSFGDCDYFIYRAGAGTRRPSLTLIPNPKPNFFQDHGVGLLPRRGGLYTVAALVTTSTKNMYKLNRFDSEAGSWTSKTVSLEAPRRPFPVKIPINACQLHEHFTTTVITIGGEAGTMGWVDLWSGILLYDLLHEDQDRRPTLRHMPLPLPMHAITCNRGMGAELGCSRTHRGIASVIRRGKACLKLADLQITGERPPYNDIETGYPAYLVHSWTITTWSNTKMAGSFEDWHEDFTVIASEITISDAVRSELLSSGLLHRKPLVEGEVAGEELALQNIVVSEPTPSLNGEEDVVYLMARTKLFHPKAWVLAVDMRNSTLLGVAEFGTGCQRDLGLTYGPSTISKYMNLATSTPVTSRS